MKRSTLIAVAVFAVLAAAGLWSTMRDPSRGVARLDLSKVSLEKADKVVLSGKNTAELKKDGDHWTLGGKLVEAKAVEQVLEAVPKMVSSSLVTRNSERFADYEVDDEKATNVAIFQGDTKITEFKIGKASSGGVNVRVDDEVFAVNGVFPRTFQKDGNAWLEKKLFTANVADVEKVELRLQGQPPYSLVKKDGKWAVEGVELPAGFRFDEQAASRVASSLVGLRAKEILDQDPGVEKTGLGPTADVLAFFGAGGTKAGEVRFGAAKEDDKTTYVQVEGRSDVMTVYESSVKNLRQKPTDLRDLTMVAIDPDKVKQLTVEDAGKKLVLEKKGNDWSVSSATDKIPQDFALDPAAVTRRLTALKNARGTAVVDDSLAAAGLTKPSAQVVAKLEDGSSVALKFGSTTKRDDREIVFAAGNADSAVYATNTYTKKNLTGLLDTFKKQAGGGPGGMGGPGGLGNLDPSALKNLPPDVRKSLEDQIRQQQQQQKMIEQIQAQQAQKPQ